MGEYLLLRGSFLIRRRCITVRGMKILSFFLFFLLVASVVSGLAQERVIKEVVVFGNERVDKAIILKEIGSKVGDPFSQARVREDIKAIYRLGYFQDVQVDVSETAGEIILTFAVIEKPFVANIVISGNLNLKQEEIEGVVEVKRDSVLEMGKVRSSVKEIKKLYTAKRYFGSEVDYRVELDKGNKAVVYFDIVEGVKGYLTTITFAGNHVFGARRLKSVMKTKEKGLIWWLTKSGKLETDVLELDINRIKGLYLDHGYVTVKVSEPEITLSKDKKSIQITIRIEEGNQYRLGSLDITGDILTTKEKLLKGLTSKVQKVYRSSVVHKDLLWLTDQYADEGYAYVDVSPLTALDHEKRLVQLTFNITKGVEAYINRIAMAGNTKTRDKVIRRELKIAEGDLYSSTRLRKSRERVMRSGYFKEVDFAPGPTEKKELIDLDIRVEENEMGRLEFGAGYSNVKGVVGSIGLSHGNLFGRGYKAYIKTEIGQNVFDYSVGFTDPRFLDSRVSLGFDVFRETTKYNYYDVDVIGGDIKFGTELTDTIRADLVYLYEKVRIYDVDTGVYEKGDYIFDQSLLGWNATSKVTLTITRDTIDNPYNPTKGSKIWVSGAIAGLGGDNYFYSASGGASWFHPLVGDLVLNLRGNAGMIRGYNNAEVPLTEKFYVGGINNLRGFEHGMAGPVDVHQEPIGALNMVTFTTEFLYPLSKSLGLRGAVFYDIGKGWGGGAGSENSFTPLRQAAGVGIRWYSPFGPIRIDWGYNLSPISGRGEKSNVWDFSMGAMF
jgi:outer membrane protein insertion porin family